MTFDPNIPYAAQSPGLFPAQMNTDLARLKTIINKDHVFNNTAQSTDGVHRQVTMVVHAQAVPGDLPAGTNAMLYAWLDSVGQAQLRYYNGVDNFKVTPGIVSTVNFNGTGAVGAQTIRNQLNVASVVKTGTGQYTVNFTSALPHANYIVQCTGMRDSVGTVSNGCVRSDPVYANSVSTAFVKVEFFGQSDTLRDVIMGNVTVMRYS